MANPFPQSSARYPAQSRVQSDAANQSLVMQIMAMQRAAALQAARQALTAGVAAPQAPPFMPPAPVAGMPFAAGGLPPPAPVARQTPMPRQPEAAAPSRPWQAPDWLRRGARAVGDVVTYPGREGEEIGRAMTSSFHNAFSTDEEGRAWAAMLKKEAGLKPDGSFAESPAGAFGPAQLMPGTAPEAAKLAGVSLNSVYTNASANERAGRAYFNMLVRRFDGDIEKAVAAYHSGMGNVDKAVEHERATGNPWQSRLGPAGKDYLSSVTKWAGEYGQPYPSFDPVREGFAEGNEWAKAALTASEQPFSFSVNEAPRPDMPKPNLAQAPDFAAADEALAAAAPADPFNNPKLKGQIRLSNALRGMGQAAMSVAGADHFGQVLLAIGGGALAGRARGDDVIQDKMDQYEAALQRHQMALAMREDSKAATLANVANDNARTLNGYAMEQFKIDTQEWERNNIPVVSNGGVTTSKIDPETGQRVYTTTPIGPAARVAYYNYRAQNARSLGAAEYEHELGRRQYEQGLATQGLSMALRQSMASGDAPSSNMAVATEIAGRAAPIVATGGLRRIFEAPVVDQWEAQARAFANVMPDEVGQVKITEQQQEQMDIFLTQKVTDAVMGDMRLYERLTSRTAYSSAAAAGAVKNMNSSRQPKQPFSTPRASDIWRD